MKINWTSKRVWERERKRDAFEAMKHIANDVCHWQNSISTYRNWKRHAKWKARKLFTLECEMKHKNRCHASEYKYSVHGQNQYKHLNVCIFDIHDRFSKYFGVCNGQECVFFVKWSNEYLKLVISIENFYEWKFVANYSSLKHFGKCKSAYQFLNIHVIELNAFKGDSRIAT